MLAVANQTQKVGQKPAGMWLLDVSDLARVQQAHALDDLKLAFFDTSGPQSRGVHWLWFVDGEFAHLATGTADGRPTNAGDDQLSRYKTLYAESGAGRTNLAYGYALRERA